MIAFKVVAIAFISSIVILVIGMLLISKTYNQADEIDKQNDLNQNTKP